MQWLLSTPYQYWSVVCVLGVAIGNCPLKIESLALTIHDCPGVIASQRDSEVVFSLTSSTIDMIDPTEELKWADYPRKSSFDPFAFDLDAYNTRLTNDAVRLFLGNEDICLQVIEFGQSR